MKKAVSIQLKPGTVLVFGRGADEKYELECAIRGSAMCAALCQMDMWLRGQLKHGNQFKTVDEALEACRAELREEIENSGASHLVGQ